MKIDGVCVMRPTELAIFSATYLLGLWLGLGLRRGCSDSRFGVQPAGVTRATANLTAPSKVKRVPVAQLNSNGEDDSWDS